MLSRIHVSDYMTRKLVTLSPDMLVGHAIGVLLEHRISGAPVLENGQLVGMFSESDCLKELLQAGYHGMDGGVVRDYMSTALETISPDDSIIAVAEIFLNRRRRRLPVLDAGGTLVGQISRRDVLRAIADIRSGQQRSA